jgi:hypothetical protein
VYDAQHRLRGVVGKKASSATAARFHGQLGSTLGVVAGRKAWIAPPTRRSTGAPNRTNVRLAASLKAAKGSNK